MTYKLTAIVSGGQTGSDRGGLQAAIDLGLGWGGWAPAGWRAEDGEIPAVFRERMRCTTSSDYGMRTRLNVQDSDGTLLVSFTEQLTGGSAFTEKTCERTRKPYLHLVLPDRGATRVPDEVRAGVLEWVSDCRISVLNVAGPRESKSPGLQEAVRDLLVWIFEPDDASDVAPVEHTIGCDHVGAAGFNCMGCERDLCWGCEMPLPAGYEAGIKTAVRWCKADACRAAEASAHRGGCTCSAQWMADRPGFHRLSCPLEPKMPEPESGTFTISREDFYKALREGKVKLGGSDEMPLGRSHEEMMVERASTAAEPVIVADAAERVLDAEGLPPFGEGRIAALLDKQERVFDEMSEQYEIFRDEVAAAVVATARNDFSLSSATWQLPPGTPAPHVVADADLPAAITAGMVRNFIAECERLAAELPRMDRQRRHDDEGLNEGLAETRALVEKFYRFPDNGAGGSLHVVLDDGNTERDNVEYCLNYALREGDEAGAALARLLLALTDEEREAL